MSTATSIEWCDFSSNPLRYRDADGKAVWACEKVSDGCKHCYSEALAHRYRKGGPFNQAVTRALTPYLDEKEVRHLLTSKKLAGKRGFLFDMTDLFGEWVPDEMIAALFGVMAARPDVTFQILTKRADRMAAWFDRAGHEDAAFIRDAVPPEIRVRRFGAEAFTPRTWPLPSVWLGVSVEDQQRADERHEYLRRIPAAVRWYSAEPLLGPIDRLPLNGISWCVVGGESGPRARPCDLAWIRSIVAQCKAAGVPAFVKQLGTRPVIDEAGAVALGRQWERDGLTGRHYGGGDGIASRVLHLCDRKGGDLDEFPADLRVREFPRPPEGA